MPYSSEFGRWGVQKDTETLGEYLSSPIPISRGWDSLPSALPGHQGDSRVHHHGHEVERCRQHYLRRP
jgi:hypothetical protein